MLQVANYYVLEYSRERARGARRKNDRQPHPLLFGRWGGGVTKNLVEYLVEWPPKIEKKHNTGYGVTTSCSLKGAPAAPPPVSGRQDPTEH